MSIGRIKTEQVDVTFKEPEKIRPNFNQRINVIHYQH